MFNDVTTSYDLSDATWEILIMLGVAFLLGYLLRYFLSGASVATPAETPLGFLGKDFGPNDLKVVEGIGPKIEELLKGGGVSSWADLANTSTDRLQSILANAGDRFKTHNPKTWPQQAALARDGKWSELKQLQDDLNGGL